ncbi:MAG: hypothetical protein ABII71_04000 [Candidatus Micrarchaeota archaeon]
MEIISISIDKGTLNDLNNTQEKLGFKSRSKLLRATISSLLNEYSVLDGLSGHCDVVFTVTFEQHSGGGFGRIMNEFEGIIRTEIHQHHAKTCLRVIIVCGDARKVRDFFVALKNEKGAKSVAYSVL